MSTTETYEATTPPPPPALEVTARPGRPPGAWSLTWHGIRTVARLELRQRIRSTRWIVALVVFGAIVGGVTLLTWLVARTAVDPYSGTAAVGPTMFGFIVFFVLFLGLLVSPTLSATSINGDRTAGTLATLQVTLLSPAEIVLGKLLASWVASLAFLAVSVPFILWAFASGGTPVLAVVTTVLLLALLLAVVCAIGLGFSALTARTSGSAVLTYISVASLSILSLIVFGLTVPLVTTQEMVPTYQSDPDQDASYQDKNGNWVEDYGPCVWTDERSPVVHTERTWWLLAINPFVIVADAAPAPAVNESMGGSFDPLTGIRAGVRIARLGPPETQDWCWQEQGDSYQPYPGYDEAGSLSPVWPWGLGANLLLGVVGVVVAVRRITVPLRTLPKGTRVA